MLGGSPTGVIVPPIFACTTIDISMGTGFKSITSHKLRICKYNNLKQLILMFLFTVLLSEPSTKRL